MKRAEILLSYMDELQKFIETIKTYIDQGIEFFMKAKEWVEKVIEYIGRGIDYLVNAIGGRKPDHLQLAEDYLFV